MKLTSSRYEHRLAFNIIGVRDTNVDRAHRGASFIVMKTDAFGAEFGIDDVNRLPLRDCVIRALGLAGAAVDAVVSNHRCHEADPPDIKRKFIPAWKRIYPRGYFFTMQSASQREARAVSSTTSLLRQNSFVGFLLRPWRPK